MNAEKALPSKRRFEPMLLLVIAIPVATVIAGIYTLFLAFNAQPEPRLAKSVPMVHGVPLQ
jgi:hypothetical protein